MKWVDEEDGAEGLTSGRKRAFAPAWWALRQRDWAWVRLEAMEAVERIWPTA